MPRGRKVSPEQVVVMLRQIEVQTGQGKSLVVQEPVFGLQGGKDLRAER